jgi:hypothetical protein
LETEAEGRAVRTTETKSDRVPAARGNLPRHRGLKAAHPGRARSPKGQAIRQGASRTATRIAIRTATKTAIETTVTRIRTRTAIRATGVPTETASLARLSQETVARAQFPLSAIKRADPRTRGRREDLRPIRTTNKGRSEIAARNPARGTGRVDTATGDAAEVAAVTADNRVVPRATPMHRVNRATRIASRLRLVRKAKDSRAVVNLALRMTAARPRVAGAKAARPVAIATVAVAVAAVVAGPVAARVARMAVQAKAAGRVAVTAVKGAVPKAPVMETPGARRVAVGEPVPRMAEPSSASNSPRSVARLRALIRLPRGLPGSTWRFILALVCAVSS